MATQNPYTIRKNLSISYTLVFKVVYYYLKYKEWRHKEAPEITLTTFKVQFSWSFKELRKEHANSGTQAYTESVEISRDAIGDTSELIEMAQDTTTALKKFGDCHHHWYKHV